MAYLVEFVYSADGRGSSTVSLPSQADDEVQHSVASTVHVIQLDKHAIERALPLVSKGLQKYCLLQAAFPTTNVASDRTFQTAFNGFYRVRRKREWQSAFYRLLEEQKSRRRSFAEVLDALHATTGRIEASFASKLVASVDPDKPVIDAFVLQNLGLRLPRTGAPT